jgi:hypothetical protein
MEAAHSRQDEGLVPLAEEGDVEAGARSADDGGRVMGASLHLVEGSCR